MRSYSVGIQLYTVRESLQKDFKGTLKKLAEMGYEGVEFAFDLGGLSPEELQEYLDRISLKAAGVMGRNVEQLLDPENELYEYAKALGVKYITLSAAGEVAKDWKKTVKDLENCGKVAREKGLQFTYHNHYQEFAEIDGKFALDFLYESTSPEYVKCEIDTYWVRCADVDPVEYIKKYAGRTPEIHVKDMTEEFSKQPEKKGPQGVVELGNGIIDFTKVAALANQIGAEWLLYEQDKCPGEELESARISIENLIKLGILD